MFLRSYLGEDPPFLPGHYPTQRFARSDTNGRLQPVNELDTCCSTAHICALGELITLVRWASRVGTRDRDSEGYVKSSRNTEGRHHAEGQTIPASWQHASPRILSMYRASNSPGRILI